MFNWKMGRIKEKNEYEEKIKELEKNNKRFYNNQLILEDLNNKQAEMLEERQREIKLLNDINVIKDIELVKLKEENEKLLNKISWLENEKLIKGVNIWTKSLIALKTQGKN